MFSTSCQYAIRAVLYLANHTNDQEKVGVEKLAQELAVPKHFLAKILQHLAKNKLVSSSKGKNGGFYLAQQEQENTLLPIIEVIDGPDKFDTCILGLEECSAASPCPYHDSVKMYRDQFYQALQDETIAEVARRITDSDLSLRSL